MFSINSQAIRPLDSPLISVIISAYNYEHFIGQTLECLQAQTCSDWECVVVDDGSMDNTAQVVARFAERDARITYIRQKNQGPSAARNNGLMKTGGRFVQFLDADDLIEAEKFERQIEYLERHTEVDIVYGSMRYFNSENVTERRYSMWGEDKLWMPEISGAGKEILTALIRQNILVINSPLIRRSVIDEVGLFDEMLKGPEDWDYWLRCAAQGKRFQYQNMEGTLALVRSHPLSLSKNREQMSAHGLRVRKKVAKMLLEADLRRLNKQQIVRQHVLVGVEKITHGNLMDGIGHLIEAGMTSDNMEQKAKWIACAGIAPIVPKQHWEKLTAILLEDSLRRIFLYKAKTIFSRFGR